MAWDWLTGAGDKKRNLESAIFREGDQVRMIGTDYRATVVSVRANAYTVSYHLSKAVPIVSLEDGPKFGLMKPFYPVVEERYLEPDSDPPTRS